MSPDTTAMAIYVVMGRDTSDALGMIHECKNVEALELLLSMLTTKGSVCTDEALNTLMAGPTKRRLDYLKGVHGKTR